MKYFLFLLFLVVSIGISPSVFAADNQICIDKVLGLSYSDVDKEFTLHVRNSILAVNDGMPDNPDMTLTLDSDTHKLIVGGHLEVLDAVKSGQAELTGNVNDLTDFLNLFDVFTVNTHGIG